MILCLRSAAFEAVQPTAVRHSVFLARQPRLLAASVLQHASPLFFRACFAGRSTSTRHSTTPRGPRIGPSPVAGPKPWPSYSHMTPLAFFSSNLVADRVLHRYYCVCRILLLGRMAELQSCEPPAHGVSERSARGLRPGARVRNTSYGANRPAGECRIWSRGTHRNASRLRAARRAEFGVDVEQGDAGAAGEPI